MASLIPFNKKNYLRPTGGFEDFYNMFDNFFTNPLSTRRSLMNDSFKLDIKNKEDKYVVEADLPGINKEEINLSLNEGRLTISIILSKNRGLLINNSNTILQENICHY